MSKIIIKTIPPEHHHQLKKRTVLELLGLSLLVGFTISQWDTVKLALSSISDSNLVYLSVAVCLYWILLPLTAISFRILSDKKINIHTTTLAQLAGSGPGRIIPGGLGRISFSVLHLKKLGIDTSKSIVITITSNLIGVGVNLAVLLLIIILNPDTLSTFTGTSTLPTLFTISLIVIGLIAVFQILLHAHKTRKGILKLIRKWKIQLQFIRSEPRKLPQLSFVALLILLGNVAILLLCAYSLSIHINATDAIIALSAGVFIGGILPTPGGIGGVEAGVASTLIVLGYSPSDSTSIAILFRTITYWQPLIPGTIAYIYLRQKRLL